ncbi:MAG: hypothetical protein ACR2JK_00245 [Geodermatophilaceae bacterium]
MSSISVETSTRSLRRGGSSSGSHEYRTFVAVPVTAGNTASGMLTIDAPNAGDLTGDDAGLLRLR